MEQVSNQAAASVDSKEESKGTKTVTTKFLDVIREREQLGVIEFLKNLVNYETENPSTSFQESISKYAQSKKLRTPGAPKNDSKALIANILKVLFSADYVQNPIVGEVVRFQNSRKSTENGIFAVKVKQEVGTEANFQVDMRKLNSISVKLQTVNLGYFDLTDKFSSKELEECINGMEKTAPKEKKVSSEELNDTDHSSVVNNTSELHSQGEVHLGIMDDDEDDNFLEEE